MQVVPDVGEEGKRPRGGVSASARCRGHQGAVSLELSELDQREKWEMLGDRSEPQ